MRVTQSGVVSEVTTAVALQVNGLLCAPKTPFLGPKLLIFCVHILCVQCSRYNLCPLLQHLSNRHPRQRCMQQDVALAVSRHGHALELFKMLQSGAIGGHAARRALGEVAKQHLSPVVVSATMIQSKCQSAMGVVPLWQMCTSRRKPMWGKLSSNSSVEPRVKHSALAVTSCCCPLQASSPTCTCNSFAQSNAAVLAEKVA